MTLWLLACAGAQLDSTPAIIEPIGDDDTGAGGVDSGEDSGGGETGDPVVDPPTDPPRLLLNEAMSKNTCSVGVSGETPDYVELYNASDQTVTLDRVALWDESGTLWVGAVDQAIGPAGWAVLYADGREAGPQDLPFTLTSAGDTLTLAVDGQVTDRLNLGTLPDDTAWARFPDGGDWAVTGAGTPGVTNGDGPAEFDDPFVSAFDLDHLYTVEVTLSDANYTALERSPTTYVEGGFALDGITLDPVGVRVRGSSTLLPITQKPSLKVDLNRYSDGEYCGDLKKINLLNMIYDTGFVKQWSAYYIMRQMGVVSSRNGFAGLSINGDYRGLYLYSEVYDDTMLESFYGYDSTDGWMIWEESGLECETNNCDNSIIANLTSIWNGTPSETAFAELEEYLDVDEALAEIAGELIVQQTDGYCAPHNFRYAYNPVTGRVAILPSSVDLTFYSPVQSVDFYTCRGSQLLSFCLDVESCRGRYEAILLEYADGIEGWMDMEPAFDQIYTMIDPYIDAERYGYNSAAQHRAGFETIRQYFRDMPEYIRSEVGG